MIIRENSNEWNNLLNKIEKSRVDFMDQEQLDNDKIKLEEKKKEMFQNDPIEEKYKKVRELKSNSFGKTLLVTDKITGSFFVLKRINAVGLVYAKMRNLIDPALPRIIYCGENKTFGITTVIEEYVNGITLSEWMKQRDLEPINDELAKMIFRQLASGLKTLHENNITHRAISPKTIMFTSKNVKFIVFDHAIEGNTYTSELSYKGLVGFAPPEQAVLGKADFRSDVYSLGMTMKNLLGTDYKGKYRKILEHCLASDPDERYQNGAKLKKAVQNAGMLPLNKIIAGAAILYVFVLAFLLIINTWFNPVKQLEAEQKFEQEQESARAEAAKIDMDKSVQGNGSEDNFTNAVNGLAKGRLGLSVAFPGRPQESGSDGVIVNMGKSSDLSGTADSGENSSVIFPGNAKLVLTIKNNTDRAIKNPVLTFIPYNIDLANIKDPSNTITKHLANSVECRRDVSIPRGSTMKFELPLGKAVVLNPAKNNAAIKAVLRSDNYADTAVKMKFNFQ
ncbi:protein kinase domain-containing protein [Pectinatus sottacetonis]|uniref:protein kinase domain-containing protein n=1 Tax=Pectinatus sottacetonis TaxID=1002795 RepID=UPI0018C5B772|nr:protein kinase [Pectinatus sottacetonis]